MHGQVVTLLIAVTLAAACSSPAEEPPPLPRIPSASASPTGEPTALSAAVPSAAQAETPEGAAAFARFFYAEVERAYDEKDPDIVAALSAPECAACDRFIDSLVAIRDEGESVTDVVYNIVSAEAPSIEGPQARVDVTYDSPAIIRRDAAGVVISTEPHVKAFQEQVTLVRGADRWLVSAVAAM